MSDENKPTLIMMVGLVGSGKSTYAKQLAEEMTATVFSSDELREEMFGDVDNQENNQKLFQELHKRIKECLKSGNNAIYDATNISSKRRRGFLSELKNIDCIKECFIMATPYEQCLENNRNRDRVVPEWVINKMYHSFNTPAYFEGFDFIYMHYWANSRNDVDITSFISKCIRYNQNNPHHSLTLGEHMLKAWENYRNMNGCIRINQDTEYACLLHDCGKLSTKTFINLKGQHSDIAHYYSHDNCGAYDALFFKYPKYVNIEYVSLLINLHMRPYVFEKEERNGNYKLRNKYRKLWGDELYNDIMALHEADKAAH